MVITTFEMILADCPELKKIQWRCVVIDEAHRLKNRNCKLLEGLKLMALVSTSCPASCKSRVGQRWPCQAVRCHCQLLSTGPELRARCLRGETGQDPSGHRRSASLMEGPSMDGALVICSHHKLFSADV